MSKAILSKTSSTGAYLKDCLHAQHYFLSLEIDDPNGEIICRAQISYDQFVKLLVDSSDVTITLDKYRDKQGKLVSEEVTPPESVQDRLVDRMGDVHTSLSKRMSDLKKDLYEMVNGKASKKDLEEALQNMSVIESHYKSNYAFTVKEASEEVEQIQENAKAQLSIFLASKGLDVPKNDIAPMIESNSIKQLPNYEEPVHETYTAKVREVKPVEEMTSMEVADQIYKHLKRLEATEKDGTGEKTKLYSSNCTHSKVEYIFLTLLIRGHQNLL